jgi:hypothetical protein
VKDKHFCHVHRCGGTKTIPTAQDQPHDRGFQMHFTVVRGGLVFHRTFHTTVIGALVAQMVVHVRRHHGLFAMGAGTHPGLKRASHGVLLRRGRHTFPGTTMHVVPAPGERKRERGKKERGIKEREGKRERERDKSKETNRKRDIERETSRERHRERDIEGGQSFRWWQVPHVRRQLLTARVRWTTCPTARVGWFRHRSKHRGPRVGG